ACSWVAWALGILAYFWINPGDVGPWREAVEVLFADVLRAPFPLGGDTTALPATAVSFAVAFAAYALLASPWRLVRRAS
ncbi:MAG TPA: hypothetical protein VFX28_10535, partial [Methylomirabilota bacterium]|nr:hypothetical protein [Methylomirabilota bacterium]